jgi:hypothetical protein
MSDGHRKFQLAQGNHCARARDLVEFARSQGQCLDELVEIIEDVG